MWKIPLFVPINRDFLRDDSVILGIKRSGGNFRAKIAAAPLHILNSPVIPRESEEFYACKSLY